MAIKSVFILTLLFAGCSATDSVPCVAGLDSRPEIDQPIRQLQEVLDASEQQQPRNYTSSNLAFALDAKLYILFHQYIETLDADARNEAIAEQSRWLDQRQTDSSKAYSAYQGGTLASYAANMAFIEATKQRIAELESRMP